MPLGMSEIFLVLPAFALVLFRITGLMLTAPFYGSAMIPVRIRAAFALMVAMVIFPLVKAQAPAEITLATTIAGGVAEMMVGATIGLALTALLLSAEVGGLIVGRQAGVALANVFDPLRSDQVSVTGQVYTVSFTLLFLLVGGHRAMMAALLDTYGLVPLLSFRFDETFIVLLAEMLAAAFVLGIRLAGPVLIALFLTGTAIGVLSRTMPQLNILTVGFAIRLMVALAVAGLTLAACEGFFVEAVLSAVESVREAFGLPPDAVLAVN